MHCGDQKEFLPTHCGLMNTLDCQAVMGRQTGTERDVPLPLMNGEDVIQEQPDQRGLTERYLQESLRL